MESTKDEVAQLRAVQSTAVAEQVKLDTESLERIKAAEANVKVGIPSTCQHMQAACAMSQGLQSCDHLCTARLKEATLTTWPSGALMLLRQLHAVMPCSAAQAVIRAQP